jgi:P-type Ca2+ transporter type 2C
MLGLSTTEAKKRQLLYGFNEIERASRVIWWQILFNQLKSPLIGVLVTAAVVTFLMGDLLDCFVIVLAVVINALLGFVQEYKAEKSIESLQKLLDPLAKVLRDGEWIEVDAREVVVGDIVRLEIGQTVPADGILIREDGMFINESILTGESVNVEKMDFVGEVKMTHGWYEKMPTRYKTYMGTTVAVGIGEAMVMKIGQDTRLGSIANAVVDQEEDLTPLQRELSRLAKQLSVLVMIVAVVILVLGLLAGDDIKEMFPAAVALAVSAIPEGLLVGLTVILAVGMRRILQRKAVVRRLVSAETLGSVDVICLDKTGTITMGEMRPVGPLSSLDKDFFEQLKHLNKLDNIAWQKIIAGCVFCNDERDPLELGMWQWAKKELGMKRFEQLKSSYERVDGIPFDPKTRFIATLSKEKKTGKGLVFLSGAPEVCLAHSNLSQKEKERWHDMFAFVGSKGYRMVAFCYRSVAAKYVKGKIDKSMLRDMLWAGIICFEDPVRNSVKTSLLKTQKAGIDLKIITGDYKETAWAVLAKLGLVPFEFDSKKVVTGSDIESSMKGNKLDKVFEDKVQQAILFARTTPSQKKWIVEALQDKGRTVAMTGDGVNDAPALKKADIGIVVNMASDVAKQTADLVLLDNNFNTVLSAIEEGRAIMDNLKKVVLYLMSDSFSAVFLVLLSILTKSPLPLSASHILWGNLISDGFPYIALAFEKKEKGLLLRKPKDSKKGLLEPFGIFLMFSVSGMSGLLSFIVFKFYLNFLNVDLIYARTMAYMLWGTITLMTPFSLRSLIRNIWQTKLDENWLLVGSVVLGFGMLVSVVWVPQLAILFGLTPIGLYDFLLVMVLGLFVIVVTEIAKMVRIATSLRE